jgi:hypothetical protein
MVMVEMTVISHGYQTEALKVGTLERGSLAVGD